MRVVDDLVEVVARYGTPEEINRQAREAGELPALLERVRATHPQYLPDLEWLAEQRDAGAFVSHRRLPARGPRRSGGHDALPR